MDDVLDKDALKSILSQIAYNVKRQRSAKNMSQLRLAVEMGHQTAGLISCAEAGINNQHFNIEQLATIAKILEIPITDLFEGVDKILKKLD